MTSINQSLIRRLLASGNHGLQTLRFSHALWRRAPEPLRPYKYVINPDLMSRETGGIRLNELNKSLVPYINEEAVKDHPHADILKKVLSVEFAKPFVRNYSELKAMLELVGVDIKKVDKFDLVFKIAKETLNIQKTQDRLRYFYETGKKVRIKFTRSPLQLSVARRDFFLTQLRFIDHEQYIKVLKEFQIKHNMKAHVTHQLTIKGVQEILEREKLNASIIDEMKEKEKIDKLDNIVKAFENAKR